MSRHHIEADDIGGRLRRLAGLLRQGYGSEKQYDEKNQAAMYVARHISFPCDEGRQMPPRRARLPRAY